MKKYTHLMMMLLLVMATAFFIGCDPTEELPADATGDSKLNDPNGGPGGMNGDVFKVSGTVYLPAAVENKEFFIAFDVDHEGDNGMAAFVQDTVSGDKVDYEVIVPRGVYHVYSQVALNGEIGPWNEGDYVGDVCFQMQNMPKDGDPPPQNHQTAGDQPPPNGQQPPGDQQGGDPGCFTVDFDTTLDLELFEFSGDYENPKGGHEGAHWTYEGPTGPEHWGELDPGFATCSEGTEQSPIDIVTTGVTTGSVGDIETVYSSTPLVIKNNGHTIGVDYEPGSYISIGGSNYELLQFHMHGPSENTVDGVPYDMEIHFVHANEHGELAVLGLFVEVDGTENTNLATLVSHFPEEVGEPTEIDGVSINGGDLLPEDMSYYHFDGSLTTPPCTEGVSWNVLKTPVSATQAQVDAFTAIIGANARPVQDLNGREVSEN